ncbi:hypothetical protein QQP08_001455 [Theobroma cacao]|nr:hypothetical protein QQP08_001455 [Theobroma cacao]
MSLDWESKSESRVRETVVDPGIGSQFRSAIMGYKNAVSTFDIHLRLKIVASSREGKPSDQKTKPLALGNLAISGPGKLHKETQI